MLDLIRYIKSSFSTFDRLLVLYSSLVQSRFEYALAVCNSVSLTDSVKLGRIQRKCAALSYTRFFNSTSTLNMKTSLKN
jgi:hypothetical protein